MFALLHSNISSLKSGLLNLIGQPYCNKGRSAKVKNGIRNLILRNYLIDRYTSNNNHHVHACWALLVIFTTVNYGRKFLRHAPIQNPVGVNQNAAPIIPPGSS